MSLLSRLVAIGKELVASGAVAGTWGNLSAWDDERGGFWITPSGMDYRSLSEQDLILIGPSGEVMEGYRRPSTELLLHQHIYLNRQDIKGIVHTHSAFATSHAVARIAIPPIVEDLIQIIGGAVEIAPYAMSGTSELAQGVVEALADKNAVLMANHGLVGVGPTLEEAWKVCQVVEKAAQIHVLSRQLGNTFILSEEEVKQVRQGFVSNYGQK